MENYQMSMTEDMLLTDQIGGGQSYTQSLLHITQVPGLILQEENAPTDNIIQISQPQCSISSHPDSVLPPDNVQYVVIQKGGQVVELKAVPSVNLNPAMSQDDPPAKQAPKSDCSEHTDKLQCGTCGQICDSVVHFLKHKISHIGRGRGQGCEICSLSFSRQMSLTDHYRRKHKIEFDVKPWQNNPRKHPRLLHTVKEAGRIGKSNKVYYKSNSKPVNSVVGKGENIIGESEGGIVSEMARPAEDAAEEAADMNDMKQAEFSMVQGFVNDKRGLEVTGETLVNSNEEFFRLAPVTAGNSKDEGEKASMEISAMEVRIQGSSVIQCESIGQEDGAVSQHPDHEEMDLPLDGNVEGQIMDPIVEDSESVSNVETADIDISQRVHQEVNEMCSQGVGLETNDKNVTSNNTSCSSRMLLEQVNGIDISQLDTNNLTSGSATGVSERLTYVLGNQGPNFTSLDANLQQSFEDSSTEAPTPVEQENSDSSEKENNEATADASNKNKHISTPALDRIAKLHGNLDKISIELNMPDFHFIAFVEETGRKSIRGGKYQFKCLYCEITVSWRSTMCRHMRDKHSDILNVGSFLSIPSYTAEHGEKIMKMSEYIQMERGSKSGKRIRGIETQDLPGDFKCDKCDKVFHRLRYLRKHSLCHRPEKNLLCSVCVKSFKTLASLNQHMKTHKDREPYKCNECDFQSTFNIAIHSHRQIHSKGCVICEICGSAYTDKSTLTKHKKVHDLSRAFACHYPGCTWRFKTKSMCAAHVKAHSSRGKFECRVCKYAFRQKHHLQRHEKSIHNITPESKPSYRYLGSIGETYIHRGGQVDGEDKLSEVETSVQDVNMIISGGTDVCVDNVEDNFDLEAALQNGQLVIATDNGNTINYEMSDIEIGGAYQTLLQDGDTQVLDSHTILIPQVGSHIVYQQEEMTEPITTEVSTEERDSDPT